jgi:hypothetical protein
MAFHFLLLVGGCLVPPSHNALSIEKDAGSSPRDAASRTDGVALEMHPGFRVVVDGPRSAHYDMSTFGPSRRSLSIRLINGSEHPIDITDVGAQLAVTWNGVVFPCPNHPRTTASGHNPSSLPPGESYTFERDVDCTMPLPGQYDVRVYITFKQPSDQAPAELADHFTFDVMQGIHAPRPYPSRPGLYIAMVGDTVARPLPPEDWARGDYHVVLGIINGSAHSILLGPVKLSFLTYKGMSSLPCSGQAESLPFPEEITSGTILTATAPVTCAPSEEGAYEIVGRFALASGGPEIEIGRIDLAVTSDPLLFTPGGPRIWELSP